MVGAILPDARVARQPERQWPQEAADIMLGHACVMCGRLGLISNEMPHLAAYVDRLGARPALVKALAT